MCNCHSSYCCLPSTIHSWLSMEWSWKRHKKPNREKTACEYIARAFRVPAQRMYFPFKFFFLVRSYFFCAISTIYTISILYSSLSIFTFLDLFNFSFSSPTSSSVYVCAQTRILELSHLLASQSLWSFAKLYLLLFVHRACSPLTLNIFNSQFSPIFSLTNFMLLFSKLSLYV